MSKTSATEMFLQWQFGVRFNIVDDSVIRTSFGSGFACFSFVRKFSHGLKGQSEVFKKLGPFNQQLARSSLADKPLVPASAGLSAD